MTQKAIRLLGTEDAVQYMHQHARRHIFHSLKPDVCMTLI